ncbi:chromosome segregation protein SMC [Kribbella sp. CA-293567]|uniref:chromosome segregation protein SMC n=1 Tax=Kribbella sp. CA-293567 TaxID=3002436 RepID=UPI0022DE8219|nr:chromosome segregation protein SMC [Kribbella sp. CA-293567]WBQ07653.1 chromosome segregation protein SMC [Kribbella sp. CA-293567]
MYLKSMTLKGFKSFASATTMNFEPGITCIVGPNGSGKSNVVDGLSWVMGEQGVKSLRGGKMEDVIFAGTSGRAPLGRAEVVLTIDNSDGALPIEFAEVTISRTMFRNGGSDYQINGQNCRLLDVQELLSDSGIGREMHVIVGQGQLDSILRATPEGRRGFVEEAAGVLKHRKRKEKALRKLESTEGNVHRLGDLIAEIRRQLKPLGRQAEVARRAVTIQAEVRDGRSRLLADDIVQAQSALEAELKDEAALTEKRSQIEAALREAREMEAELEDALRTDAPALQAAQDTWYSLSGFGEKIKGTARIAADRIRSLNDEAEESRSGRDPEELELEAARVRETEAQIEAEVEAHSELLQQAIEQRQQLEAEHAEEERRIAALIRAAADRREGMARLTGQVNALKSRASAAESEIGRLASNRSEAEARAAKAQHDFTALETQVAGLDAGERGLDEEYEAAQSVLDELDERLTKLRAEERDAERERAGLTARKDALEMGLNRKDGAGALLAASEQITGLMGSVAALLSVRAGYETAIAAALGEAADAVAVTHTQAALDAVGHLKEHDLGRAGMLLGDAPADDYASWPSLPPGATYAVDVVECPATLRPALRRLLRKVAVVEDVPAARDLVQHLPDITTATRAGDVLGAHFAYGGSDAAPSLIEVQSAVDEATEKLTEATARSERLRFELAQMESERTSQKQSVEIALARLHESDASMAAVAEQLAQFGSLAKASRGEAQRMAEAIAAAEAERDKNLSGLADLEKRLSDVEQYGDDEGDEPDPTERDRLAEAAKAGRASEMEARLALRTTEERARALSGRADSLERAARQEREARARAIARATRRARQSEAAQAVHLAAGHVLARLESSLQLAATERSAIQAQRAEREQALAQARSATRNLSSELEQLTNTVHRDALARAEQKMRLEALYEKALGELGTEVEALVAEYGPDQLVPPPAKDGDDNTVEREGEPFDRAKVQKRLKTAERALNQLGRINPLALEEFDAMEERHRFLAEQLEDLKKSRRDLMDIVKEVDDRVEQVFTEAYRDVEVAFQHVFSRLFPGGEGRLVLTDPSDMLNTGIDVEARPPGKKVKRLSLLSGGERSLVAVAFLVALFKARPSPFYILDEVEAALDDTNLGRLLEIYEELRENSQLLVITHQKRTMEVADALYGVTMRGDGVSAVISQRIRETEPA